jgi:enoyl-[acyl-carrier-protein] reductase (NADH)
VEEAAMIEYTSEARTNAALGPWTPDLVKDASIDDVGVAVAFLSMNGAKLITGETLYINGGYHIID